MAVPEEVYFKTYGGSSGLLREQLGEEWRHGRYVRRDISDVDATAALGDYVIAFTSLSAPRSVTLPLLSEVGLGQSFIVSDESLSAGTHNITIGPSGGESIEGNLSASITGDGGVLIFYRGASEWKILQSVSGGGGGATTFLGLSDTPGAYTGQGGRLVRVNVGETGLEFFDLSDTDDLPEGSTNLYFTEERVDDRVAGLVLDGANTFWTYDDAAGTLKVDVTNQSHIAFTEGSVLFADATGIQEDNGAFFWDGANDALGLGSNVVEDADGDPAGLVVKRNSNEAALYLENVGITNKSVFQVKGPVSTGLTDGKAFLLGVAGDTFDRIAFYTDGKLGMGSGSANRDVFLSRFAANQFLVSSDSGTGLADLFVRGEFISEGRAVVGDAADLTSGTDAGFTVVSNANASDFDDATDYHLQLVNPQNDTGERVGLGFTISAVPGTNVGASIMHRRTDSGSEGTMEFRVKTSSGTQLGMTLDSSASMVVGTAASADASAILDVGSTTKGFLAPRMTEVQRDAVSSPATGLIVFNTTSGVYQFFDSSDWVDLGAGGGTEFLTDQVSERDGDFYFFGGNDSAGDWKINRYPVGDVSTKVSANEVLNPSFTDLTSAFASKDTLVYA